ncbi:MAG: TIGR04372 family glycosyltransferase [Actinomycetota bacterium]|nr:TIGR04372 family glycosyltransferase [Actinomycetota bacterium]
MTKPSYLNRAKAALQRARYLGIKPSVAIARNELHLLGGRARTQLHSDHVRNGGLTEFQLIINRDEQVSKAGQAYSEGRYAASVEHSIAAAETTADARRQLGMDQLPIRICGTSITSAIGHIAVGLGTRAKLQALGLAEPVQTLVITSRVANIHYLSYFEELFTIDQVSWSIEQDLYQRIWPLFTDINWIDTDERPMALYEAMALAEEGWESQARGPLLALSDLDRERGFNYFAELGMTPADWFVTLHVRSDPKSGQEYGRNANVHDYAQAIDAITAQGGWVIRLGSADMPALAARPHLIDLSLDPHRPNWVDVFAIGGCKFFIGTTSGPHAAASSFGRPVLLTNATGIGFSPYMHHTRVIPKLLRRQGSGQVMSIPEFAQSGAALVDGHLPADLSHGSDPWVWRDNSPVELREATQEMLNGEFEHPSDEQQRAYQQLMLQLGSLAASAPSPFFLRQHQ